MTRKYALYALATYLPHYVVVRWAWRFGPPTWTIESREFADKQIAEYGDDYVQVAAVRPGKG